MKKRIFISALGLLLLLLGAYALGPRPEAPRFETYLYAPAPSLAALESEIQRSEAAVPGLKPDCAARIVWADTSTHAKTRIALLYLHGFGASPEEGAPVPADLARRFGCNLYLARLDGHGLEAGDNNLCALTADSYYESAEKALAIARQLGDSVVVLGTSGGGALSVFLCARHPEIKGLVLWSPAIQLYDPSASLLAGPWGLRLARLITGASHHDWKYKKPVQARFWTNHQCWEGIVQFSVFLKYAMTPGTFAAVKCPVFMGYYYESEEKQDKVVSVEAMRRMFDQLGADAALKREMAFPKAHDHVIVSQIMSDDWQSVESETARFMEKTMGMGQ